MTVSDHANTWALLATSLLGCATDAPRRAEQAPDAARAPEASAGVVASAGAPTASADAELGVSVPSAYAKYCTGTLTKERRLQRASGSGNWVGRGETAAAGTVFLVDAKNASYGSGYGGVLRMPDGVWAMVSKDSEQPFTKDVDFTSSCTPDKPPSAEAGNAALVLIGKATFFSNKELQGRPCVLPAATAVSMPTRYEWLGSKLPVEIVLKEATAACGWPKAYTDDFHDAELFSK